MDEIWRREREMEDIRDTITTIKNQLRDMEWWARTTLRDVENLERDIGAL